MHIWSQGNTGPTVHVDQASIFKRKQNAMSDVAEERQRIAGRTLPDITQKHTVEIVKDPSPLKSITSLILRVGRPGR